MKKYSSLLIYVLLVAVSFLATIGFFSLNGWYTIGEPLVQQTIARLIIFFVLLSTVLVCLAYWLKNRNNED